LKHHLDGGIRNAFKNKDAKLAAWLEAKAGKVDAEGLTKASC
jgi:small subunit ribosomal protein S16